VAEVAGVARGAVVEPPAHHQPAADAGRDGDREHVGGARPAAAPVLAGGQRDGVVVEQDRDGEVLGQPGPEREVAPGRDVQR
jgi:hypothetical protein